MGGSWWRDLKNYRRRLISQKVMSKTIPKKKKCKKANWLPEEALQRAEKRREARKGKIYSLECRVLENSKENKESLLQ